MAQSQDMMVSGREVDGYRIRSVLGRGGMGIVYMADDVALSRPVALKMIDPALARDEAFVRRFRSEARALARVNSPFIVNIHTLRKTDVGMFIVMEYVDGNTVADLIDEGPLAWDRAYPIIRQMLLAFEQAHGVGVVHRDIKPRNIMLTRDGTVKVTDFGLAKLAKSDGGSTMTQGVAGTLFYMSPEQVKGLQDLDHRSDLYSLGMTIYEMMAGQLPFDRSAGDFAVMRTIVETPLPPPSQFRPDLPDALCRVIMKALEKDPARRYERATEMLAAFEAYARERQEGARGTPPASGRRRRVAAVVAAALLAGSAAGGGYLLFGRLGPSETTQGTIVPYPDDRPVAEAPVDPYLLDEEAIARSVLEPRPEGAAAEPSAPAGAGGGSDTRVVEPPGAPAQGRATERTAPAMATVRLRAADAGVTVRAAGQTQTGEAIVQLPPGTHTVTFVHPQYGERRETIAVDEAENKTLTYYFTGVVNIPSPLLQNGEERWCTIEVDGETQEGFTPKALRLGPGRHTISLRKVGYDILSNGQQVEIRPGFTEQEHALSFGIRER